MSLTASPDPPAPADPGSPALFAVERDGPPPSRRIRRVRGGTEPSRAGDADPGRQLSLFGVEAVEPSPADLAGLIAGPGQVDRMGGTARISIVVDAAWRVHVLVAELARRGLAASWVTTVEQTYAVRTSYTTALAALGRDWARGPGKLPPDPFHLDGPRLRLWAAAAGIPDPVEGFLLRLGPADGDCWPRVGEALAAIGLAADLVGPADGGPAYRITGRRLARLAELVGERPPAAPPARWPGPDMTPAPLAPPAPAGPEPRPAPPNEAEAEAEAQTDPGTESGADPETGIGDLVEYAEVDHEGLEAEADSGD